MGAVVTIARTPDGDVVAGMAGRRMNGDVMIRLGHDQVAQFVGALTAGHGRVVTRTKVLDVDKTAIGYIVRDMAATHNHGESAGTLLLLSSDQRDQLVATLTH